MNLPTFADVLQARKTLRNFLPPTPLHRYPGLDELLGAEVYIKHENYQPTGAFKLRGGINFLANLDKKVSGVVSASTGNHGQSIAYAARLFGVRALLVAPENANPVKVHAMRGYGAEVVLHGPDFEASKKFAEDLARREGFRFISSGDEPLLIAGVATHTLEIFEQQPELDAIFVPLGGGSGAAGTCLAAKTLSPSTKIIAVGAAGAPAGFLSWKARGWRTAEIHTLAGGLATGEPFLMPQQILWDLLDEFLLVEDPPMLKAMRWFLERAKTLAEPAGAAPLAAAFHTRELWHGKKIALILSGGNASPKELAACLQAPPG